MTQGEWKELRAAQQVFEQPDRHTNAEIEYAKERLKALGTQAIAEMGETTRQIGVWFQAQLNAALPAMRQLVAVAVEAGLIEAPPADEPSESTFINRP